MTFGTSSTRYITRYVAATPACRKSPVSAVIGMPIRYAVSVSTISPNFVSPPARNVPTTSISGSVRSGISSA